MLLLFGEGVFARIPIEAVQREFQGRAYMVAAGYVTWPPCPCGTLAYFPPDGFYGDLDHDKVLATQLVQDLADKFYNTAKIYVSFLNTPDGYSGIQGQANLPFNYGQTSQFPPNVDGADMSNPYGATPITTNNFAQCFATLKAYISFYETTLTLPNTSGAVWQSVTNLAVLNNGSNPDIITNANGNIFLPQSPENFSYDLDGNLTQDGRWQYTWDAENRLVSMQCLSGLPAAAKLKLDFFYDDQGRRIQKLVSTNSRSAYVAQLTNRFVYDGWNIFANLNPQSTVERVAVVHLGPRSVGKAARRRRRRRPLEHQ